MTARRVPLVRPMSGRDADEEHRASTPLELFFDLVMVVAIASGAAELHHGLAEGHLDAVVGFGFVFFAIWLAWLNYTWFASAYDTDDVVFRLLTFVIMAGSLTLAAGVPDLFDDGQSVVVVAGYCVMRLAMVVLWLRATAGDGSRRRTCLAYAVGIALVQVFWVARLLVDDPTWLIVTFLIGVLAELAVPFVAEGLGHTPFHPEHMAERYGLFTIIVLGEVVLSTVLALQGAVGEWTLDLGLLVAGSLLIVFAMWWFYFKGDLVDRFRTPRLLELTSVGYGHFVVFAAVAATGAALAASVDVVTHHAHTTPAFVQWALVIPVALYVASVALLHGAAARVSADSVVAVLLVIALLCVPLQAFSTGAAVLVVGVLLWVALARHLTASESSPVDA